MSEMQSTTGKANPNFFEKQVLKFDNARFAWMAMGITLQSCLGSMVVMFHLYFVQQLQWQAMHFLLHKRHPNGVLVGFT